MNDLVNRPAHYTDGRKYEPIDVFEDWFCAPDSDPQLSPLLWQVCKYVSRAGRKGDAVTGRKGDAVTDLRKAEFYLKRAIAREALKETEG